MQEKVDEQGHCGGGEIVHDTHAVHTHKVLNVQQLEAGNAPFLSCVWGTF